jgi:hypothetical protein
MEVYDEIRIGLEEGYLFYAPIDQLTHPIVDGGWLRLTSMAYLVTIGYPARKYGSPHRIPASERTHYERWGSMPCEST